MAKLMKIGALSLGKLFGILYALMGLISGIFIALFSLVGFFTSSNNIGVLGPLFGVGAIIFLPLFYGVMGFILGIISAFLYNVIANWVGGIDIYLKK